MPNFLAVRFTTIVTEFKLNDQKLYLSPILDLFNGEVVRYNLSRHPNFKRMSRKATCLDNDVAENFF